LLFNSRKYICRHYIDRGIAGTVSSRETITYYGETVTYYGETVTYYGETITYYDETITYCGETLTYYAETITNKRLNDATSDVLIEWRSCYAYKHSKIVFFVIHDEKRVGYDKHI
jgi:hypothetical protein